MARNAAPALVIRAARPSDRRCVRELCSRIWNDDYIPTVFDEWVRDRRGRLWVATVDDRVVGVAKLTVLGDHEAWLHALRVDSRSRRRGVATALLEQRLKRARQLGVRVARLDTSADNVAVHRLMRRFGFRVRQRSAFYVAPAAAIDPPRHAVLGELAALSRLVRKGDGLVHQPYTARLVGRSDLVRAIRAGTCVVAGRPGSPSAAAIVEPYRPPRVGHGRQRLAVRAVGGSEPGLRELLRAVRGFARREGMPRVGIPAAASLWPAARAAGYRRAWRETMVLFERRL